MGWKLDRQAGQKVMDNHKRLGSVAALKGYTTHVCNWRGMKIGWGMTLLIIWASFGEVDSVEVHEVRLGNEYVKVEGPE